MGDYANSLRKRAQTNTGSASSTTGSLTSGRDSGQGRPDIGSLSPSSVRGMDTLQRPLWASAYDLEEGIDENGEDQTAYSRSPVGGYPHIQGRLSQVPAGSRAAWNRTPRLREHSVASSEGTVDFLSANRSSSSLSNLLRARDSRALVETEVSFPDQQSAPFQADDRGFSVILRLESS
jgi:hypothetical protein